ncbi:hypothetical protein PLESTB_000356700 [Pleodorina starrii]|uniref:Uncharacterized protein n=1 Tax=Pleodorina starrii TaxID=330485 RepID=A0A9W6BDN0_9CHLO|nr:hypothetical protein PLESTM_000038700 [Pleodorina starrii]GLC50229.1 hypothetical protein PLESTB_000356700 [Pleodorina starrii]GLC64391.1 hypothetical protein PLESTF_000156300 [Pleodorina starrii]
MQAYITGGVYISSTCIISRFRGFSFGGLSKSVDKLPTRETWFCLYQPQPGRTAYLYEYDVPIDNQSYVNQVAPELKQRFGRPARECYIHAAHGESFTNCDVAQPPWYCYRLLLAGVRVGRRLGPYAADDLVAPNRVTLPLQGRWRNNIRDARDLVEFLAAPTEFRLTSHLHHLLAAAHQDDWRSGAATVQQLLVQRWGHEPLRRHGLTPQAIRQAYDLYGKRMWQEDDGGGDVTAAAEAAERRAARRRQRLAAASGSDAAAEAECGLHAVDWEAEAAAEHVRGPDGAAAGVHGSPGGRGGKGRGS